MTGLNLWFFARFSFVDLAKRLPNFWRKWRHLLQFFPEICNLLKPRFFRHRILRWKVWKFVVRKKSKSERYFSLHSQRYGKVFLASISRQKRFLLHQTVFLRHAKSAKNFRRLRRAYHKIERKNARPKINKKYPRNSGLIFDRSYFWQVVIVTGLNIGAHCNDIAR